MASPDTSKWNGNLRISVAMERVIEKERVYFKMVAWGKGEGMYFQ